MAHLNATQLRSLIAGGQSFFWGIVRLIAQVRIVECRPRTSRVYLFKVIVHA
jgi:hypothetical protein